MKRKNKVILGLVFIAVSLMIFAYIKANQVYQTKKKEYYTPKIVELQTFARQEKDWIIENQGDKGHIFMNYKEGETTTGAGDVNPYFASFAAQGLLTGEVKEEDMQTVKRYVDWHMERFIKEDAELTDYTLIDGDLVVSTQADSVDSYIAVFISLLVDYIEQGGEVEQEQYEEVVELAVATLDSLLLDGLTTVDFESNLIYLMDNLEVQTAYRDLLTITDDAELRGYLEQRIEENQEAITSQLWNQAEERYEIGINDNGDIIQTLDVTQLYPDGIAQIYNIAFDIYPKGRESSEELYDEFNQNVSWEHLLTKRDDEFFWSELFYIAALMGDTDRASTYLDAYETQMAQSRDYPFHTATAGWAIKAASALSVEYEQRINQSLLDDFLDGTIFSK